MINKALSSIIALIIFSVTIGGGLTTFGTETKVFAETPEFKAISKDFDVDRNDTYNGQLTVENPPVATVSYAVKDEPTKGTVTINPATGAFEYVARLDEVGLDTFTFTASSGGQVREGVVGVTIVDTRFDAVSKTLTVQVGRTLTGRMGAEYVTGNPTFIIATQPTKGTITSINALTGDFTYVPDKSFTSGTDTFTFTARNGNIARTEKTGTITIRALETVLTANNATYSTPMNTTLKETATSTSGVGAVTYSILENPAHGTVTMNANGQFEYTPNAGFIGRDTFIFSAQDTAPSISNATITIDVTSQAQATEYDDMLNHWGGPAARKLAEDGMIHGDMIFDHSYFHPDQAMRRIDFVIWTLGASGVNINNYRATSTHFADVDQYPEWVVRAAVAANENGIMKGSFNNGRHYIDAYSIITRAEAFVLFNNIVEKTTTATARTGNELEKFEDRHQVPDWARHSIERLLANGLIQGDGTRIMPNQVITRAAAGQMIINISEWSKKHPTSPASSLSSHMTATTPAPTRHSDDNHIAPRHFDDNQHFDDNHIAPFIVH